MTTPQRQVPMVIELSSEQISGPSRRQFCAHACQAASLVAVSALLPACGGGGDDGNPTSPDDSRGRSGARRAQWLGFRPDGLGYGQWSVGCCRRRGAGDGTVASGQLPRVPRFTDLVHRSDRCLHSRGLHRRPLQWPAVRLPVSQLEVHDRVERLPTVPPIARSQPFPSSLSGDTLTFTV